MTPKIPIHKPSPARELGEMVGRAATAMGGMASWAEWEKGWATMAAQHRGVS